MIKSNVTRLLDSQKISYTAFELPIEKLGAEKTAELLGVPLAQVFKTIVVVREGGGKPILAVVPGTSEVDLKVLAKSLQEKKLSLPTEREAERLTGLKAGGISPLALLQRGFQVIVDSSSESFDEIHISGGQLGLNLRLSTADLVRLTHARLAAITRSNQGSATG